MDSDPGRVSIPVRALAALCGTIGGLLSFALAAALWRVGQGHIAALWAESMLLGAMAGVSGIALLAQPTRLLRARVPVGRAVPHAWWPVESTPLPALAGFLGVPVALGSGAAVLIFR